MCITWLVQIIQIMKTISCRSSEFMPGKEQPFIMGMTIWIFLMFLEDIKQVQ